MTFLEICRMVARESGTISGSQPLGVMGQTGRLFKVVEWVKVAWTSIQNSRSDWKWLQAEFQNELSVGTGRYTAAGWSLSRHAEWITRDDSLTAYKTSSGVSDERPLRFIPWSQYRRDYERGAQVQNRPLHFTVSPANELCFGPIPDDAYTVRGEYRKAPQTLVGNDDVPEMPPRFHELIGWEAFLLLAEHDEAQLHIAVAMRRQRELRFGLERDQLPKLEIGEALA